MPNIYLFYFLFAAALWHGYYLPFTNEYTLRMKTSVSSPSLHLSSVWLISKLMSNRLHLCLATKLILAYPLIFTPSIQIEWKNNDNVKTPFKIFMVIMPHIAHVLFICVHVYLYGLFSHMRSEVTQSSLTLCDPMDTRLLNPWDFLGKGTGVGCHFLLQGIFPTQG